MDLSRHGADTAPGAIASGILAMVLYLEGSTRDCQVIGTDVCEGMFVTPRVHIYANVWAMMRDARVYK